MGGTCSTHAKEKYLRVWRTHEGKIPLGYLGIQQIKMDFRETECEVVK